MSLRLKKFDMKRLKYYLMAEKELASTDEHINEHIKARNINRLLSQIEREMNK